MVNIELTKQQAEELKNFYISELEKIKKREDAIKELLSKLGTETVVISLHETKQEKVETPDEITLQEKIETKNPKWSNFIIRILQEKQEPLPRNAFMELYEQQYNVKFADPKRVRTSLEQALQKLRKDKKIESLKGIEGKEKLYGLIDWADKSSLKTTMETEINTKQDNTATTVEIENKTTPKIKRNWSEFIRETLNNQKHILPLSEFVKYAMHHFELPEDKMKIIRGSLSPILTQFVKKSKFLKFVQQEGVRGKSYGLAEWFDVDGNLIIDYK